MSDKNPYSAIPEGINNLANAFFNPRAEAEGRRIQASADLADEQRVTEVEHRPLKSDVYRSQAKANTSSAEKADAERKIHEMTAAGRQRISELFAAGALVRNPDGTVTMSADIANQISSGLALAESNPSALFSGVERVAAFAADPRNAALLRNTTGATRPDAAFTRQDSDRITAASEQAALARTIAARGGDRNESGSDVDRGIRRENEVDAAIEAFQPDMDPEWKVYIREEALRRLSPTVGPKTAIQSIIRDMGITKWEDDKDWAPGTSYSPRSATRTTRTSPTAWNPPTAAPPVRTLGPPPRDASQRQVGGVYDTPRGPAKWTGQDWILL